MKIDKGIDLPSASKYPWAKMDIGDSFLVETENPNIRISLHNSWKWWRDKNNPNAQFIVRKVEGGYRVWRTENKTN